MGVDREGPVGVLDHDAVVALVLAGADCARELVVDDLGDRSAAGGEDRRALGHREVEGVGLESLVRERTFVALADPDRARAAEGHSILPAIVVHGVRVAGKRAPRRSIGVG